MNADAFMIEILIIGNCRERENSQIKIPKEKFTNKTGVINIMWVKLISDQKNSKT